MAGPIDGLRVTPRAARAAIHVRTVVLRLRNPPPLLVLRKPLNHCRLLHVQALQAHLVLPAINLIRHRQINIDNLPDGAVGQCVGDQQLDGKPCRLSRLLYLLHELQIKYCSLGGRKTRELSLLHKSSKPAETKIQKYL